MYLHYTAKVNRLQLGNITLIIAYNNSIKDPILNICCSFTFHYTTVLCELSNSAIPPFYSVTNLYMLQSVNEVSALCRASAMLHGSRHHIFNIKISSSPFTNQQASLVYAVQM